MLYFRFNEAGSFVGTYTGNGKPTKGHDGQTFVGVTDEDFGRLVKGSSFSYTDGKLVETPLSDAVVAAVVRAKRKKLLDATDWTAVADADLTVAEKAAYKKYRTKLRDLTNQEGFPKNVAWPVAPAQPLEAK